MVNYYRVLKDTFMWEEGAILSDEKSSGQMVGVEDIWDKHKDMTEYISLSIVKNSPDFFERVYKDKLDKSIFYTKEQMKKLYEKFKK